jgi:hypothetical protein
MRLNRWSVAALIVAFSLIGKVIFAQQYAPGVGTTPVTAQLPCPEEGTPESIGALCISVVIPPGAPGLGSAAFGPNPLNVGLGTTVIWVNQDSVAHTVTSDDGSFESGTLTPGQAFSHTFNVAGTFTYYCSIHGRASMNGSVAVSTVPASGSPYVNPSYGVTCPSPLYPYPNFPYPYPRPRPTPTRSPSRSPSPSPSPSPSVSPSQSPSSSPSPSASPSPSVSPS